MWVYSFEEGGQIRQLNPEIRITLADRLRNNTNQTKTHWGS